MMLMQMMKGWIAVLCLVGMEGGAVAAEIPKAKIFVPLGHSGKVSSAAYSPDGNTIVSGSNDNTIKLWDATSGRELNALSGHRGAVNAVAYSPDGRIIVSGGDDSIKLWDVASKQLLRTLSGQIFVTTVAFSPDGRLLVSGSLGEILKLWDIASGREIRTMSGHKNSVKSVAFSPDGRTIVSGSDDKTLKLWDVATGRELLTLSGHSDNVRTVDFSPDGRTLVSGGVDNTLKLWDVASGRELRSLSGHTNFVNAVAFSPNGRTLVSGSRDKTLKLWDLANGLELHTFRGHSNDVSAVAFSPDGRTIISGSGDTTIKLWNVESGQELRSLRTHASYINAIALSPNGRTLVSGSQKHLKLWDFISGRELLTLNGHSRYVGTAAFSPDGRTLVSGSWDKTIKLWDVSTGKELRTLNGHNASVDSVAFSPDGRTIVSGSADKTLKLWDVATGRDLQTLSGHSNNVTTVVFSPNGRTLASGSADHTLKLWDVSTGKELRALSGYVNTVTTATFSPDGRILALGSGNKTVNLWDVASGQELKILRGHDSPVNSVAFSTDGHTLVSSAGNDIKLWDVASGSELKTISGHENTVNAATFTRTGLELISASGDGTIRRWNVASGMEIAKFVSFDNGEWIAITPEGYYNSSERGGDWLNVRLGNKVQGINQFYDVFYRPDIVEAKLRGEDISSLITLTIDDAMKLPPPEIAFTAVPSISTANAEKICYKALATGGGIGEVRLFQNGKLIKSDGFYRESVAKVDTHIKLASVDGATVSRALKLTKTTQKSETPMVSNSKGNEFSECQEVETIPGDNEISVAAFNANNTIQSRLETVNFKSSRKPEEPHLYVLGIGIDKYTASENNLSYAVKDATDFRGMIQEKAKGLFNAANIHIEGLNDAAATKVGIQQAIAAISAKVKPWDSFILFVASHGYLQDNQYYIVTSDFDGAIDTSKMISSNEIVGMSKNIKSLSQLLIFDTCHAGGVDNIIGGLYDARMSVMAKKMGLHIYASAGGTQTALDGYQGNGLFTHSLLKSMKTGTTDSNRDSEVSVAELGESARQETITISKQLGFPQSPNIINFGKDNVLFKVK